VQLAALAIGDVRKGTEGTGMSVAVLAERYLGWVQRYRAANTYRVRKNDIQSFVDHMRGSGSEPLTFQAVDLLPLHITGWLDRHPGWGANQRRAAISAISACLNWGVKEGYIPLNPLARRLEIPPAVSRGDDHRLTEGDFRLLLSGCWYECQRELLIGLHQSGCRPGEIATVTAERFDPAAGVWYVRGKTGERAVGLTPQLLELSRKLAARYPTGPLFRNTRGGAWTPKAIDQLFSTIRAKLKAKGTPVPDEAIPYAFRHTYATGLLQQGVPSAYVARQMGHSPTVLHKHYSHLRVEEVLPALRRVKPLDAGTGAHACPDGVAGSEGAVDRSPDQGPEGSAAPDRP
jgi:integrase